MAPYRHFRDKAALLSAVALRGFDDLRTVLLAADAQSSPSDALVAQGEAYIAFARMYPTLFRLMFSHRGGGPPLVEDAAYGVLVKRVRQLAPDNMEAATLACWSAVHGMATLTLDGGLPAEGSPHERDALLLIVRGLVR
jgi:AcrR family transcriptional regulator